MSINSTGPIRFSDLQNEFGGSDPIGLGEYYAGAGNVPTDTVGETNIPTSGPISIGKFHSSTTVGAQWGPRFIRPFTEYDTQIGIPKIRYFDGKFIYPVTGGGSTIILMTSTNGIDWTQIKGTVTNPVVSTSRYVFYDIGWDGTTYILTVNLKNDVNNLLNNFYIFKSTDLTTWTSVYEITTGIPGPLTWGIVDGAGLFVAPVHDTLSTTSSYVYTSPDGTNWTQRTVSGFGLNSSIISDAIWNGFVFVVCGEGQNIAYSVDGINWIVARTEKAGYIRNITWGNNTFVAHAGSLVLTSLNGVTWTEILLPDGYTGDTVAWSGLNFVTSPGTLKTYSTSPDGINWTGRNYGNTLYPSIGKPTTTSIAGGGKIISLGVGDTNNGGLFLTVDHGVNWTTPYTGSISNLSAIETNGTYTVVGGSSETNTAGIVQPTLLISLDGYNWVKKDYGATGTGTVRDIIWNGTRFVVGIGHENFNPSQDNNAAIITSTDGLSWTIAIDFTTDPLGMIVEGLAWNGTKFVCVGSKDATYHSTDGVNWIPHSTGTTSVWLSSVAWGSNKFVAGGSTNTRTNKVYYSDDGITWAAESTLPDCDYIRKIRFLNNKFVLLARRSATLGTYSQYPKIFTSDDGINWSASTFTDTPRGLFTDVTYAFGKYYAIMAPTTTQRSYNIYSSTDGSSWSPSLLTDLQHLGASYNSNQGAPYNVHGSLRRLGKGIFYVCNNGIINSSPAPSSLLLPEII